MSTYYALMDAAAKRADEYQDLDWIKEILLNVQKGTARPQDIAMVLTHLREWEKRVTIIAEAADSPTAERAREALRRLEALRSALEASSNVAHR